MAAEERSPESYRELRLEGFGLMLAATLLAGLLGAAFFAGRWTERRSHPDLASREPADPLAAVTPAEPVPERPESYFDKGTQKQTEPRREVETPRPAPSAPATAPERPPVESSLPQQAAEQNPTPSQEPPAAEADQGARPARAGDFQIQVFAGRDREAAEQIAARLREQGYRVQSLVESEGASELFKVRVGAYSNADEARRVAQELSGRGYPGAWVIRVE